MDGSATCSIELVRQNNIRHCQNMSVLNTWNTLPRNNRRVLHGRLEILLVELQGRSRSTNLEHHHVQKNVHTRRLRPLPIDSTHLHRSSSPRTSS